MPLFSLDYETFDESVEYPVLISTFDDQSSEQRRLKSAMVARTFTLRSPALTYAQLQAYRDFYDARQGALTAFTFVNPEDGVTYNVRFVPGSFKSSFIDGIHRCSFQFKSLGAV